MTAKKSASYSDEGRIDYSPDQAELDLGREASIQSKPPAANDNTAPANVYGSAIGTLDEYGPEISHAPAASMSVPPTPRTPLTAYSRLPVSAPFKNKPKPPKTAVYKPRNRD